MRYLRVLVVDDDPDFLAQANETLSSAKYSVTAVSDFEKAEAGLRGAKGKTVVVSELRVGGECGLEFLSKTLKLYPQIPFIFLSSAPSLESVIGALKQGAYDFLRKPVDAGILRHSVARSVEKLNLSLESENQEKEGRGLLARSREELKKVKTLSDFKGFLISTASHDIRSVLTVLDGYHQIIREKCAGCEQDEPRRLLEQARRSIYRLRTMTSTLLDYEAADRGELTVSPQRFPLDVLLKECAAFYRPYAEQKKVDLDVEDRIPNLMVNADAAKVTEVLDNIIYNAVKFTPPGGVIRIGARAEGGAAAAVWVRDTGAGIPKSALKKIFDRQEIASRKDGNGRIGLGLNICKKLIEAQSGKIWMESAPGKGTKVFFSLPR